MKNVIESTIWLLAILGFFLRFHYVIIQDCEQIKNNNNNR